MQSDAVTQVYKFRVVDLPLEQLTRSTEAVAALAGRIALGTREVVAAIAPLEPAANTINSQAPAVTAP